MSRNNQRASNVVYPIIYTALVTAGLTLPYLYDGWLEFAGTALVLPVVIHTIVKLVPRGAQSKA